MSGKGAKAAVAAKGAAVAKAAGAAKAARVGGSTKTARVHQKVHFYRPKTLELPRAPKYKRSLKASVKGKDNAVQKVDNYRIVRAPLTTEAAMKKIEDDNTLVFLCDPKASKRDIKKAVEELYEIKTKKINTLIRPDGVKKAYVKLTGDFDALDVSNRIGII
jgi:large subunit ribosomal protein L23Ae